MLLKKQNRLLLEASNIIVDTGVPLSPITTTPKWHTQLLWNTLPGSRTQAWHSVGIILFNAQFVSFCEMQLLVAMLVLRWNDIEFLLCMCFGNLTVLHKDFIHTADLLWLRQFQTILDLNGHGRIWQYKRNIRKRKHVEPNDVLSNLQNKAKRMPVIVVRKTRKYVFEGPPVGANLLILHTWAGDGTCQLLSSYKLSFDKALFLKQPSYF